MDRVTRRVHRYVARRLLPALHAPGQPFSLQAPAAGMHSRVWYLDIPGQRALVLKGVSSRDRFEAMLQGTACLRRHGMPVPEIVHAEPRRLIPGGPGMHLVCEERIAGHTLFELGRPVEAIAAAGRLFARLHAVTAPQWGPPGRGRTGGLADFLIARTRVRLDRWRACDRELTRARIRHVTEFLCAGRAVVDAIGLFSLCHGDPNPGNILIDEAGQLWLLDTGNVRFLPRFLDCFTLELNLCEEDPVRQQALREAYHGAPEARVQSDFDAGQGFFRVCVLAQFGATLAQRHGLLAHTGGGDFRHYLQVARHLIETCLDEP